MLAFVARMDAIAVCSLFYSYRMLSLLLAPLWDMVVVEVADCEMVHKVEWNKIELACGVPWLPEFRGKIMKYRG